MTARYDLSTVSSPQSFSFSQQGSRIINKHTLHKDALDANANKSAIQQCNKVLKKYPDNELAKVCAVFYDLMMVGWAYVFCVL